MTCYEPDYEDFNYFMDFYGKNGIEPLPELYDLTFAEFKRVTCLVVGISQTLEPGHRISIKNMFIQQTCVQRTFIQHRGEQVAT